MASHGILALGLEGPMLSVINTSISIICLYDKELGEFEVVRSFSVFIVALLHFV